MLCVFLLKKMFQLQKNNGMLNYFKYFFLLLQSINLIEFLYEIVL
jgi:hypothetical protein